MADAATTHNIYEWTSLLAMGGFFGALGQGARVVVGLKKLKELNQDKAPDEQDVFVAGRLVVSLMIGFIAGGLGGLTVLSFEPHLALSSVFAVAAIGYAGADAIEGMTGQLAAVTPTPAPAAGQSPATDASTTGQGDLG